MKSYITSVLVSAAVFTVCAGRVFDEKQDAIKQIDEKLKDVVTSRNNILELIKNERANLNSKGEEDLLKHLNAKSLDAKAHLDKEVIAVIQKAIVSAKPITVIHCIRTVSSILELNIDNLRKELSAKVTQIRVIKSKKIDLDEFSAASIIKGLTELIDQAKTKIRESKDSVKNITKDALAHCETAIALLGEIEVHIHEPILSIEYVKMRQEIDKKHRELKSSMETSLGSCLK